MRFVLSEFCIQGGLHFRCFASKDVYNQGTGSLHPICTLKYLFILWTWNASFTSHTLEVELSPISKINEIQTHESSG